MDAFMKKIRKDPELKELRGKRKRLKATKKYGDLSDVYCEMGDCLRRLSDEASFRSEAFDRKIGRKYANAIEKGKLAGNYENCSLASRALAEMAMDNDAGEAFTNIENSMRYALKAKNPSFIQLAFHQCAYIFSATPECLEKAADIAERGLVYLRDHSAEINADTAAVASGGDSARRKAGLENLLGGIYLDLDNDTMARLHNERCLDYTSENNDYELHCRALLLKLRMTAGPDRLNVALDLKQTSERLDKKSSVRFEADFYLGAESLRFNVFLDAKRLFWRLHAYHFDRLDEDLRALVDKYLIFIFKTERRLKRIADELGDPTGDESADRRELRAQIYEKIADEASDLQLSELAFTFYEKMLKSCASVEQKRLALVSLAETARELKNFPVSAHFFHDLLRTERKLGYSDAKMMSTEISIAIVSAFVATIPLRERQQLFEDTYQKCMTTTDKVSLLTDYIEFLEQNAGLCGERELSTKRAELERLRALNAEDDDSEDAGGSQDVDENLVASSYTDELDHANDWEIFAELKNEMKIVEEELLLSKCVDAKVNNEGETRLHVEARSDNYEMLKKLVQKGYNVNARDHGGWTPLSEAISAGQLRNARFLLQNGADVNCRSIHGVMISEEEEGASGYTPLMEACAHGNLAMVRMLIGFKANVTQKDDDGWTAVDYLREYLRLIDADVDESTRGDIVKCIDFMERQQIRAGFTPRRSPPPRQRRFKKFVPKIGRKRPAFGDDGNGEGNSRPSSVAGGSLEPCSQRSHSTGAGDGFNSDDSMDRLLGSLCAAASSAKKKAHQTADSVAMEERRNLRDYRNTMLLCRRQQTRESSALSIGTTHQKASAVSLADAKDRQVVSAYNKLDDIRDVLPADRAFIAPEEDENDDNESGKRTSRSQSLTAASSGRLSESADFHDENEDDILSSIRARRLKRPRLR